MQVGFQKKALAASSLNVTGHMLIESTKSILVQTFKRFVRFGIVGASGLVVDMGLLFLLADPKMLAMNLSLSKALAASMALVNNFIWNEFWTFGDISASQSHWLARMGRFIKFNIICLVGIALSIFLLYAQVRWLRMNVYLANLIAIIIASFWNFGLALKFGWRKPAVNFSGQVSVPQKDPKILA